ncbi:MAG: outer membrane beta-barrel protein [Gallionella sp.]
MHKIPLAVLLSTFVVTPAIAADMYAGVRLGKARTNITGVTYTQSTFGVLLGYTINQNWSVEAEQMDLGYIDTSNAAATSFSAMGFYPGNEPLSFFAKLSYVRSSWEVLNQAKNKSFFSYGLGAQYDATQTVSVRLGWDNYKIGNQTTSNVQVLSIAGIVKF